MKSRSFAALAVMVSLGCAASCSATKARSSGSFGAGASASSSNPTGTSTGSNQGAGGSGTSQSGAGGGIMGFGGATTCALSCSADQHSVIDCHGNTVQTCTTTEACDPSMLVCAGACSVAVSSKAAIGCEYYPVFMDQFLVSPCFAAMIANTWDSPVHISADYAGTPLTVSTFAAIPSGMGTSVTYAPYDATAGLPPGEVALLFLSGDPSGEVPCPLPPAVPTGVMQQGSAIGNAFHITTDVPVVAYQMNPYGGGSAETTGASLLLPTSVWDTNYIAVNVAAHDIANPSMNIVATDDNTVVTIVPVAAVTPAAGIPGGAANTAFTVTLNAGQHAQISQSAELTGSVISATHPIGFMAGQECERWPIGNEYCDHGEQMVPPIKALGSEYVGVMYRPRIPAETYTFWRLVGVVDGTNLTWNPPDPNAPATLSASQSAVYQTGTPFDVKSQDSEHPFMLFTYMSGNQLIPGLDGYGDPDFVLSVPPQQYLTRYVFFTDPTYPETDLVLVRTPASDGTFKDVTLDCLGVVPGWTAVGAYEWTRVDLSTGDFQPVGKCSTGAHVITSDAPFGLWVWGWGTPNTSSHTRDVSYGYPGGMNVQVINQVIVPPPMTNVVPVRQ